MRDPLRIRRRRLVTSPLEWQMTAAPVPHPVVPVTAERGGTQLRTPRGTVLVDTREQNPFDLRRFQGWFAGVEEKALELGDYSVAGLEDLCVVERKELSDLVRSCTVERKVFVDRLRRMARYPHRLLVIDEPTKGLSPAVVEHFIGALLALKAERTTLLLVEQNFRVAQAMGDDVAVMDQGRIIHTGSMAALDADMELQQRLLGLSLGVGA